MQKNHCKNELFPVPSRLYSDLLNVLVWPPGCYFKKHGYRLLSVDIIGAFSRMVF